MNFTTISIVFRNTPKNGAGFSEDFSEFVHNVVLKFCKNGCFSPPPKPPRVLYQRLKSGGGGVQKRIFSWSREPKKNSPDCSPPTPTCQQILKNTFRHEKKSQFLVLGGLLESVFSCFLGPGGESTKVRKFVFFVFSRKMAFFALFLQFLALFCQFLGGHPGNFVGGTQDFGILGWGRENSCFFAIFWVFFWNFK